jgi:hypothetical protein
MVVFHPSSKNKENGYGIGYGIAFWMMDISFCTFGITNYNRPGNKLGVYKELLWGKGGFAALRPIVPTEDILIYDDTDELRSIHRVHQDFLRDVLEGHVKVDCLYSERNVADVTTRMYAKGDAGGTCYE